MRSGVYLKAAASGEPVRIVHRLDRGTSGVMLFPKDRRSAARLSTQFKEGRIEKRYLALVAGEPLDNEWLLDAPIAKVGSARYGVATPGKEAQTEFRVVARAGGGGVGRGPAPHWPHPSDSRASRPLPVADCW
jgi:23S rRNA-/tRNA-specific pseudouridylate synthase